MHKKLSLRASVVTVTILLIALFSFAACTKSKLGPVPTLETTQQAQVAETKTPGSTTVAVDETPTLSSQSATAIPTMTPTTEADANATPTPTTAAGGSEQPTATPAADETPTATPEPSEGAEFEYVVKTGDTLWGLAVRFGTTVEEIKARNQLASNVIYKGDKLIMPGVQGGESVTHVVQPGENLFRIALKYNTTVEAIAAANNIINPSFVYAGQQLTIVKGSGTVPDGGVRYHVVQPGENLSSIAMKYNTTPWTIAAYNGISNINFIYAGRTLRIP